MGVRRNSLGPLSSAQLTQIGVTDGVVFWKETIPPEILPLTTDEDYIVTISDRHDLLAQRKLGSSHLGWAIMERNRDISPEEIDMRLWPNDFVPGRVIKIPTLRSLQDRDVI